MQENSPEVEFQIIFKFVGTISPLNYKYYWYLQSFQHIAGQSLPNILETFASRLIFLQTFIILTNLLVSYT